MRVPNLNKIRNASLGKEYITKKIEEYDLPDRVVYEFTDEKSKRKFVSKVERFVRSSIEYTEMIVFLRQEIDMTQCSYFNGITKDIGISIEIHHAPFTLFDIVYIVLEKHIEMYGYVNILEICEEVMIIHYRGLVGLIPVTKTVHKLIHNGVIFVPSSYVYGNVAKFYDEYKFYMTDEHKENLETNNSMSESLTNTPEILETRFVYLEIDGMRFPEMITG